MGKEKLFKPEDFDKPAPTPKSKKWLWVIAAAVLVAGAAVVVTNLGKNEPELSKIDVPPAIEEDIATVSVDSETFGDDVITATEGNLESGVSINENSTESSISSQDISNSEANTAVPTEKKESSNVAAITENKQTTSTKPSTSQNGAKTTTNATAALSSSLDDNALRVVRGEFGNGKARKEALGSRYGEIQARVNEMYREGRFN